MLCFLQDCFQDSYTGSLQARQLEQCGSLLPLLVPSTRPQEITVPGGVMKGSSVYPAVAVLPCVQHGAKVQPWETAPLPANPKHPTLMSPPCATWLTRRLSLLPHKLADIQEGAFDPAARKNAWWYQVYVCPCNGRLSKVFGTQVLPSSTVTQDLGAKMRDLWGKAVEMVIFIWERLPAAMASCSSQSSPRGCVDPPLSRHPSCSLKCYITELCVIKASNTRNETVGFCLDLSKGKRNLKIP